MEETKNPSRYPTNWGVCFLCDCKKQEQKISIHKGVAQEISTHGVSLLSNHQICLQKKVAMQLMIPSTQKGAPQKIVKIIGQSIDTVMTEGKFLTEIEFVHFEEDGFKELDMNLRQRFDTQFFNPTVQRI